VVPARGTGRLTKSDEDAGPPRSLRSRVAPACRTRDSINPHAICRAVVEDSESIEWVPGFPHSRWLGGFLLVLFGSMVAGESVASWLASAAQHPPVLTVPLFAATLAVAIGGPASAAYYFLMPFPVTLGVMSEGLIVDVRSSRAPRPVRRWAWPWGELRLHGRRLVLSRSHGSAPRSIRLTTAQVRRLSQLVSAR
jgi:hypothetical protein